MRRTLTTTVSIKQLFDSVAKLPAVISEGRDMAPGGEHLASRLHTHGHKPQVHDVVWRFTSDGKAICRETVSCDSCRLRFVTDPSPWMPKRYHEWVTRRRERPCMPTSSDELRRKQRLEDTLVLAFLILLLGLVSISLAVSGIEVLRTTIRPIGLVLAGVGLPMAVWFASKIRRKRVLRRVGVSSSGSVVDTRYMSTGHGGGGYRSTVQFASSDGTEHSFKTVGELHGAIEIIYDPDRPTRAQVAQNIDPTFNEWIGTALFGGVLLGGVVFFVLA